MPILEDDPYGEIWFDRAAAARRCSPARAGGAVTYLGTGSKMVAPGLRVAWMVIPDRELRDKIVTAKQGADLHSSTYAQYVFHAYVEDERRLGAHLARVRATYRGRRDAMIAALAREMPPHVRWNVPDGGMFLWATVGAGIDTEELFERAVRDQRRVRSGPAVLSGQGPRRRDAAQLLRDAGRADRRGNRATRARAIRQRAEGWARKDRTRLLAPSSHERGTAWVWS